MSHPSLAVTCPKCQTTHQVGPATVKFECSGCGVVVKVPNAEKQGTK